MKKSALENSFYQSIKFTTLAGCWRGQCLFPLATPVLKSDDNVVPVQVVSHLGGAKAAGVKPP